MAAMSKDELIALIEQAFADSVYPGDDHISTFCAPDCDEVAEAFRGKHWKALTDIEFLRHWCNLGALTFFDDPAFRFYVPAFMLAALVDSEIDGGIVFHLDPLESEERAIKRLNGFNPDQRRAIKAYMQYSDEHDW